MSNIKSQIGGPGGVTIEVDAVTIAVRLEKRRHFGDLDSPIVETRSFEVGGATYRVDRFLPGDAVRCRPSADAIGRAVLRAAGIDPLQESADAGLPDEPPTSPSELALRRAVAAILEHSSPPYVCDRCAGTYLCPCGERSGVEKVVAALFRSKVGIDAVEPEASPEGRADVDAGLAFRMAADWLESLGGAVAGSNLADAAQRLRGAAGPSQRAKLVLMPPREEWPEGMSTESPNELPCVQFDNRMRTPDRAREVAVALLAAADAAELAEGGAEA